MVWQRYDSIYEPGQQAPFKISRSKIDAYLNCPRCFWLDRRMGIKQPSIPSFNLNSAVDELLKTEFDAYRAKQQPHPYMIDAAVDAVPFQHEKLDEWRHTFTGVQALHAPTNLMVFGAVDDLWVSATNELIVVDYKSTSKNKEITDLDPVGGWHDAYRRQMEVYQWLLRQNEFEVSDTGYFVYANGKAQESAFKGVLRFDVKTFPYTGNADWVEQTLKDIKVCLEGDIPEVGMGPIGKGCEHCGYAKQRTELTLKALQKRRKASK